MIRIRKLAQWIKQLNMFKWFNCQNRDAVKQQYIITRVYLILLAGIVFFHQRNIYYF
jgi:hypothetical protein